MPELVEVEAYRRVGLNAIGRTIADVTVDAHLLAGADPAALGALLRNRTIIDVNRHGKLLTLGVGSRSRVTDEIGLHFGMTGQLLVDDVPGMEAFRYAPNRVNHAWDRLIVTFVDGGTLVLRDPRRFARIDLDPTTDTLGPDARNISAADFAAALGSSKVAVKARLLDQSKIAGVGNLLADEILWRSKSNPATLVNQLSAKQRTTLHRQTVQVIERCIQRGGSHLGDFIKVRGKDALCPRCKSQLEHATVGGRSTYWCPTCQTNR
jgi:formamidopyrimidine-DNA glycosylase